MGSIVIKPKAEDFFHKPFIHVLAIIFVVLLIYSNTLNASFQFDDFIYIVDNPSIKDFNYFIDPSLVKNTDSPSNVKHSFKTRYMTNLTFALNYRLEGLYVRGYHLVNILIHIFNSLLLYWFMSLTFKTPFFSDSGRDQAFTDRTRNLILVFSALFFAVHPIQTQAVTYITQRFASLATLFYLLTLVIYIQFRLSSGPHSQRQRAAFKYYAMYGISLLLAILAMYTKEIAFTLPVVMVIYEFMFFQGEIKRRVLYLVPFVLTMLTIPLTLIMAGGSMTDISKIEGDITFAQDISRLDYLYTQFRVIVTYIRLLFLPINQNLDYDYPIYHSFFIPAIFLSCMFLLLVFTLGLYLYRISRHPKRKDRYLLRLMSFGILWFFVTLSVESTIIPIADVIVEHRAYLPSVGFFMALSAAIGTGVQRWGSRSEYTKYVLIAIILVLSGATYTRNAVWQDKVSLWKNAVEGSPKKARPHHNLGLAYEENGLINAAIKEYQTAIKFEPYYNSIHLVHNNLGAVYFDQGRINEAIKELNISLMIKPDFFGTHYNLGVVYETQGRKDDAIKEFNIVIKLRPNFAQARQRLDFLLKK